VISTSHGHSFLPNHQYNQNSRLKIFSRREINKERKTMNQPSRERTSTKMREWRPILSPQSKIVLPGLLGLLFHSISSAGHTSRLEDPQRSEEHCDCVERHEQKLKETTTTTKKKWSRKPYLWNDWERIWCFALTSEWRCVNGGVRLNNSEQRTEKMGGKWGVDDDYGPWEGDANRSTPSIIQSSA